MKTKKILALALAAVLLVAVGVGGTLAWLTDDSDTLTNTFTETKINVSLGETTGENYEMVPGRVIAKDPKVTLETGSEPSYVFVKITQSGNFEDYMNAYEMTDKWTQVGSDIEEADGSITKVWKYNDVVNEGDVLQVLAGGTAGQVTVKDTVTKTMMDNITKGDVAKPTLGITAYAIQSEVIGEKGWSDAQIWELAQTNGAQAKPSGVQ